MSIPSQPAPLGVPSTAAGLARDRLARKAAPFIWMEAARRMAERLPLLRHQPDVVLDMGCAWGAGLTLLRKQYARAEIIGIEPSQPLADLARTAQSPAWLQALRRRGATRILRAPFDESSGMLDGLPPAQMVWSNLALPWVADLEAGFAVWQRLMAPDGVLMFTTFGPDTLRELRQPAVQELGIAPPAYPDMHDLGDMLVHQGFAEPVMDMEMLHLRYADPQAALLELSSLGRPPHTAHHHGLRTPRQWHALQQALLQRAHTGPAGPVELTFELVYGHAYKPATRRAQAGVASFSVEDLRASRRKR